VDSLALVLAPCGDAQRAEVLHQRLQYGLESRVFQQRALLHRPGALETKKAREGQVAGGDNVARPGHHGTRVHAGSLTTSQQL
jgi:hypothetical protein